MYKIGTELPFLFSASGVECLQDSCAVHLRLRLEEDHKLHPVLGIDDFGGQQRGGLDSLVRKGESREKQA